MEQTLVDMYAHSQKSGTLKVDFKNVTDDRSPFSERFGSKSDF